MSYLHNFIKESNAIEGITRDPLPAEVDALLAFLQLSKLTVKAVENLVSVFQPNAVLRAKVGLDVRVGSYYPPRGGAHIRKLLEDLLGQINAAKLDSFNAHRAYEDLHPFTDGNGRSGRAIWLWQLGGRAPLGFLHTFYYQTLGGMR